MSGQVRLPDVSTVEKIADDIRSLHWFLHDYQHSHLYRAEKLFADAKELRNEAEQRIEEWENCRNMVLVQITTAKEKIPKIEDELKQLEEKVKHLQELETNRQNRLQKDQEGDYLLYWAPVAIAQKKDELAVAQAELKKLELQEKFCTDRILLFKNELADLARREDDLHQCTDYYDENVVLPAQQMADQFMTIEEMLRTIAQKLETINGRL